MPSYLISLKPAFMRLIHAKDTLLRLMFDAKSDYELNLINSYLQNKDSNSFCYFSKTLLNLILYHQLYN